MTIIARILLCFTVCVVIPGTASAQRSLDGSRRAWEDCEAKLHASPEFLALNHRIGSRAYPDIAFSTEMATPEEAEHLRNLLRNYVLVCRRFSNEAARAHLPSIIPFLEEVQARSDANHERLIVGQITWGQFIRDAKALDAELEAEIRRHEQR